MFRREKNKYPFTDSGPYTFLFPGFFYLGSCCPLLRQHNSLIFFINANKLLRPLLFSLTQQDGFNFSFS